VWEIEKRLPRMAPGRNLLSAPGDLPIRAGQGLTVMTNSIYNGYRYEDIWLER